MALPIVATEAEPILKSVAVTTPAVAAISIDPMLAPTPICKVGVVVIPVTLSPLEGTTSSLKVDTPAVTTKPPAVILTPVCAVTRPTESTLVTSS